jgi:hypothetical protein
MTIYASSTATRNGGGSTGTIEVKLGDPLGGGLNFDVDVIVTILEGSYAFDSSDYPSAKIVGAGPRTRQFQDVQFASGQVKSFRYNWKNGSAACDYVIALWGKESKTGTERSLLHFHWGRISGTGLSVMAPPSPLSGLSFDRDLFILDELRKLREAIKPQLPGPKPPLPEKPSEGTTREGRQR